MYYIVYPLFCFAYIASATNNELVYKYRTCLSGKKVTSEITHMSLINCALISDILSTDAFSFNSLSGICRIFTEDINASPVCGLPHEKLYARLNNGPPKDAALSDDSTGPNECPVPIPPGYGLQYPFGGGSDLARYTCSSLTDEPPVDSCPIVKCSGPYNNTNVSVSCSVKDVFNSSSTDDYYGGVTCTVKGVACQRWDSNYPHTTSVYSGRSDLGNRCKLETESRPWCYTTDPDTRWDYCPVPEINCEVPPTLSIPSTMKGAEVTIKKPHMNSDALAWCKCLSLGEGDPLQGCPVTRCEGLLWSKANISCSVKDCYDVHSKSYEGRVSCTELGNTCQRWDSNYPHTPMSFVGRSDLENWCQLEGEPRPWCYTTDPNSRWEFCAVIECP